MRADLVTFQTWLEAVYPWLRILIVWLLAWLALRLIRRLLRGLHLHLVRRADAVRDARRIDTLMNVFRYGAHVVIVGMAIMLTLGAIGLSITPLLATAGVAGIAVGFGAQSLVKDFFTGLFLLIENQVSEGDNIEAAGRSGVVERVTLRHIRIRDDDGAVHFIPNGMITAITNRSRDYSYAVIDVNVPRQDALEHAFAMLRTIGAGLRADPEFAPLILAGVDIAGVEKLEDAVVSLRCRLKVQPGKQWRVRREFLRRVKEAMDNRETTGTVDPAG